MKYWQHNTNEDYEAHIRKECIRLTKQQNENIGFFYRAPRSCRLEPVSEERFLTDKNCHMRIDGWPFMVCTQNGNIVGIKKL